MYDIYEAIKDPALTSKGKTRKINEIKISESGIIEIGTIVPELGLPAPTITTAYNGVVALREAFKSGDFVGQAKNDIECLLTVLENN